MSWTAPVRKFGAIAGEIVTEAIFKNHLDDEIVLSQGSGDPAKLVVQVQADVAAIQEALGFADAALAEHMPGEHLPPSSSNYGHHVDAHGDSYAPPSFFGAHFATTSTGPMHHDPIDGDGWCRLGEWATSLAIGIFDPGEEVTSEAFNAILGDLAPKLQHGLRVRFDHSLRHFRVVAVVPKAPADPLPERAIALGGLAE